MLIAQITDTHIKPPGKLAYSRVDTAKCPRPASRLAPLDPQPDLIVHTGDLTDFGTPEEYEQLKAILRRWRLRSLRYPATTTSARRCARRSPRMAICRARASCTTPWSAEACASSVSIRWSRGRAAASSARSGSPGSTRRWARARTLPTVVMMHHPPFLTGIGHMDRLGLDGRDGFAAVMRRHDQVQAILCGHVHRPTFAHVGGRPAMICPSPAHQVVLDLRPEGASAFRLEPPGYMLHRWQDGQLVSHVAVLGDWPGPFPFFNASGALIDG